MSTTININSVKSLTMTETEINVYRSEVTGENKTFYTRDIFVRDESGADTKLTLFADNFEDLNLTFLEAQK